MLIKEILLEDYRIYNGKNSVQFFPKVEKNVFIISGNNGFGKTTFLTSLVWCLYGKLIIDVDDKYKREVYEAGGYKKYATNSLNRKAKTTNKEKYSVELVLVGVQIPSLPCQEIRVKRTFSTISKEDYIEILIDGEVNELTKEVGPELFIQDFVLPKEIARFFFFDAEKIVELAEVKTVEDKRKLSKAYSEVLGIKKYEDLRNHLKDLRLRFRRKSATDIDRKKFEILQKEITETRAFIQFKEEEIVNLTEEKGIKRRQSDQYQEKLIREGNSLTLEELKDLKELRDQLLWNSKELKSKLREFLELAPFAIAGNKLSALREQILTEANNSINTVDPVLLKEKCKSITKDLFEYFRKAGIGGKDVSRLVVEVEKSVTAHFSESKDEDFRVLLDFTETERNEFEAIYSNLKQSYSRNFKQLIQEEKNNRISLNKVFRKISDAETKENDLLIQGIRNKKSEIDQIIKDIEEKIIQLSQEVGGLQNQLASKAKVVAELVKKIDLEVKDERKDQIAERLINKLTEFITDFKKEKKKALENRIGSELNSLMHKSDFISKVEVEIEGDIIDINLFNDRKEIIFKESLSKGEQQLYATSILKALVDESNVQFPIFIDSPLQKFDKHHSKNIISEFYPKISEQVVLFPLLEKELSEQEYKELLPKVNSTFLIENVDQDSSRFKQIEPTRLFEVYKENNHVYTH